MCVIAFSPKGKNAPTEEQIRAMFTANPDGAGYAFNGRNGVVEYKKGFMSVDALLKELAPLSRWKNTNLAIHFRIGTAGKNDEHTCHPFPISTDFGELRKTSGTGPVLFHNGILDKGGLLNPLSSDTQDFVAAFAPMLSKYSKSKVRDGWLEEIVTGNRLLVMYNNNKFKMYGRWERDGDLFVSNTHYQAYSHSSYAYSTWTPAVTTTYTTNKTTKKVLNAMSEEEIDEIMEIEELWNELSITGMLEATGDVIRAMLDYADKYNKYYAEKNGIKYFYDLEDGIIYDSYGMDYEDATIYGY